MDKISLPNKILFSEVSSLLFDGHMVTLRTKGDSMFPFIAGGRDSVVLQRQKQVRPGDIVLACIPKKGYVLHRVYQIRGGIFVLMGDGNTFVTEQCRMEDIQGTVFKIVRNGRFIDCNSPVECWRVRLWRLLLPVRCYLLPICRWWTKLQEKTK